MASAHPVRNALLALVLVLPAVQGLDVAWTFDGDDGGDDYEHFNDQVESAVFWDAQAGNVKIVSQRADPSDEQLIHRLDSPLVPESSIRLSAEMTVEKQSHYQGANPLFLSRAGATQLNAEPSAAMVQFFSRDQSGDPALRFFFRDSEGTSYSSGFYPFSKTSTLAISIAYDPPTATSAGAFVFSYQPAGGTLRSWSPDTPGTPSFLFGKVGFAAEGRDKDIPQEAAAIVRVDDVSFSTTPPPSNPPDAPTVVSPADGATGVGPFQHLRWASSDPDGDTLAHEVYVAAGRAPDPATDAPACGWTYATTCDPGRLAYLETYQWLVRVSDGTSITTGPVWSLQVRGDPPPDAPVPSQPADGATSVEDTATVMRWTGGLDPDGDPVTHDVLLDAGTTTPATVVCNDVAGNECTLPGRLTYDATYSWRVVSSDGVQQTAGPVATFTAESDPQPMPAYDPSPVDGATGVSRDRATLSWSGGDPDGDPVTYDVYFQPGSPPDPDVDAPAAGCTGLALPECPVPTTLADHTEYHWLVRTSDGTATTDSDPWQFRVEPSAPPLAPSAPTPAVGSLAVPARTTLAWEGGDPDVGQTVTYSVYAGLDDAPTALVCTTTQTTCDATLPGPGTVHWQVVASDGQTSTAGPVWSHEGLAADGWTTYAFDFDNDDGGFQEGSDFTKADVSWNPTEGRWDVAMNREPTVDELAFRTLHHPVDDDQGFRVTVDWWDEYAFEGLRGYPLILSDGFPLDPDDAPGTFTVAYESRSWTDDQVYRLRFRDASGDLRINSVYRAPAETVHTFQVEHDTATGRVTMRALAGAAVMHEASAVVGSAAEGFSWDTIAFGADGPGLGYSGNRYGWVDDIELRIADSRAPTAPSDPSPEDGATLRDRDNTRLAWTDATDPDDNPLTHAVYVDDGTGTRLACAASPCDPGDLPYGADVRWWVVASDGKRLTRSEWSFQTEPSPVPYTPTAPTPADGATGTDRDQVLSWTGGSPDDEVTYRVYLRAGAEPTATEADLVCTTTATTCDAGRLPYDTVHHWLVVATGSDGTTTAPGPGWTFTVKPDPTPSTPTAPGPADGLVGLDPWPVLSWGGGVDPDGDPVTLRVYLDSGTATPTSLVCVGAITTCDPGRLDYSTTYAWRVVADDGTNTVSGPTWTFDVKDDPAPTMPSAPSPADGATGVDPTVVASWSSGDPDGDPVMYTVTLWADGKAPEVVCVRVVTQCDFGALDPVRGYNWRVEADDGTHTVLGPVWTFETGLPGADWVQPYATDAVNEVRP